jgi:hypothetical protein
VRGRARLGIVLLIVAVVVVGVGIWQPWRGWFGGSGGSAGGPLTTVHGVIGSEKRDFFADERVKAAFAEHGLDVVVDTAGSREIATTKDLAGYDFGFPSSTPAAQKLAEKVGASATFDPFSSPMAVFTWSNVAELLERNGVLSTEPDGSRTLDVAAYLALVDSVNADGSVGARWNQLDGAAELYNSSRSVLIGSTDIRKSNSAAMYMDIVSYVLNGNGVVTSDAQLEAILPSLSGVFVRQGYSASSSDEPFKDYLAQGSGSKPLVVGYEAQFLGEQLDDAAALPADAVMAYLSPTVYSKHVLVPFDDAGTRVGELLQTDPTLQALATEHGFRTPGPALAELVAERGIPGFRADIVDVADTPSYDMTEQMIARIEEAY